MSACGGSAAAAACGPSATRLPRPATGRGGPLVDGLLQRRARGELRDARCGDLDLLAGSRVAALACAAVGDAELAKSGEDDIAAALQCALDGLEHRVNGVAGVLLAEAGPVGDLVHEFRFGHLLLLLLG